MREKISFEINKNTAGILEAEVLISEPLEVLSIMVDVEQSRNADGISVSSG